MKNIVLFELDKYKEKSKYELIETGVYKDLNDFDSTNCRIVLSFQLEANEEQYPLEDLLDEFYLYISDYIKEEDVFDEKLKILEFAGELEDVKKLKSIIGKRVYNKLITKNDGKTYSKLEIE